MFIDILRDFFQSTGFSQITGDQIFMILVSLCPSLSSNQEGI